MSDNIVEFRNIKTISGIKPKSCLDLTFDTIIELINKHNINEIWDVTTSVNLFRNKIDGSNVDSTLTRAGYGGFVKCLSNTKLSKTLNIQVVGNYYAPTVISQGVVKSYGNIDLALKKTFMKNMANLTLNVNDLFIMIENFIKG